MRSRITLAIGLIAMAVLTAGCFLNVGSYREADGSLTYVGEVYNTGEPIQNAEVEGRFYDANGNLIATQAGPVCQVMPAKGIAAFQVTLPPGTPDPARVEWTLLGERVPDVYLASGLVADVTNTINRGNFRYVYGELRNTSGNQYYDGYVCAAWVNEAGTLLRVTRATAAGIDLGPGESLPFGVFADVPPDAARLQFYLDAGVYPPGFPAPTVIDLPAANIRHQGEFTFGFGGADATIAFGEVANSGSLPSRPEVSAVARDASGKLVGVSESVDGGGGLGCPVSAAPGEFTFYGYALQSPTDVEPVISIESSVAPTGAVLAFSTSDVEFESQFGLVRVTGTARNTSSEVAVEGSVCVGVYDSSGDVVGVASTSLDLPVGGLAPNASVPFETIVFSFGDEDPVDAKAVADGTP